MLLCFLSIRAQFDCKIKILKINTVVVQDFNVLLLNLWDLRDKINMSIEELSITINSLVLIAKEFDIH